MRPEIVLQGDEACLRNAFANMAVSSGASVRKSEPGVLVVGRADPSFAAQFLLGSRFNTVPEQRTVLTLLPVGSRGVRIVADSAMVTNPGTGFERILPVRGADLSPPGRMAEETCRRSK